LKKSLLFPNLPKEANMKIQNIFLVASLSLLVAACGSTKTPEPPEAPEDAGAYVEDVLFSGAMERMIRKGERMGDGQCPPGFILDGDAMESGTRGRSDAGYTISAYRGIECIPGRNRQRN